MPLRDNLDGYIVVAFYGQKKIYTYLTDVC